MSLRTQLIAWCVLLVVLGLFLWTFRGILLPFVLGIGLAYLLNPLVGKLTGIGFPRPLAVLVVTLFVALIVILAILIIVPVMIQQAIGLVGNMPFYFGQLQNFVESVVPRLEQWLGPQRMAELETGIEQMFSDIIGIATALTGQIMQSGAGFIGSLTVMIVTPVVTVYMLIDWDRMVQSVDGLFPPRYKSEARALMGEMDTAIGGFLRGQGAVLLILAVFYGTALSLAGLHFGLAIGIFTGLFSFIPYLGSFLGLVLSMGVGFFQFWPDWISVAIVGAIYLFGQLLESYFLYPKLVGSSIRLHPVWMMFAIFAFAALFGIVGVLLAVPLAAISGVLLRWAVTKYKQSPLYTSETDTAAIERTDGPQERI
ncbi:AI-2E family transporter [Pelagibacterium lacus]|uniref:AI-2E family transporter n=1 Tax=Pelagibacterium lacus TaxID=2282655 RepID=A0A369W708_9HYPH|nr:AI-2E family transporter [Pelagibacterium lacus]RDE09827.1 AI-2E family transporter [Pelagibacterium lacus]